MAALEQQELEQRLKDEPGYDYAFDYAKPSSLITFDADIPALPPLFDGQFSYTPMTLLSK